MRPLAVLFVLAATSCGIPSHGPAMRPGEDCNGCHSFSAAGTLFTNPGDDTSSGLEAGRVHLTDANGRSLTLKTNEVGNFYTNEDLAFPVTVVVERRGALAVMLSPAPTGGCNRCHLPDPPATELPDKPPGRVALTGGSGDEFMLPGYDCQRCHGVGGQAATFPYTASGTVFAQPSGGAGEEAVTVSITDAQGNVFDAVTNRVGNFTMTQPIAFGPSARVRITKGAVTREMDEELPHGSCNACHRPGGEGERQVSLAGDD